MSVKRAAIVGTAPSWSQTPWDDPGLRIVSLNDAYALGLPRVDEWYDFHPVERMVFRDKRGKIDPATVPEDHFIRPLNHLEWLKKQSETIPVWLHTVPEGWPPNARQFPKAGCMEAFGHYFASGPSWILVHLILRGYTDIQIYGIHLSTEKEYIEQRPNFEYLLGRAEERGVKITFPKASPILKHDWLYAFESRPKRKAPEAAKALHGKQIERAKIIQAMAFAPVWRRPALRTQLKALDLEVMDLEQRAMRHQCRSTIAVSVAAAR